MRTLAKVVGLLMMVGLVSSIFEVEQSYRGVIWSRQGMIETSGKMHTGAMGIRQMAQAITGDLTMESLQGLIRVKEAPELVVFIMTTLRSSEMSAASQQRIEESYADQPSVSFRALYGEEEDLGTHQIQLGALDSWAALHLEEVLRNGQADVLVVHVEDENIPVTLEKVQQLLQGHESKVVEGVLFTNEAVTYARADAASAWSESIEDFWSKEFWPREVWEGVIVSFILLVLFWWGISMLATLQTPYHFDDPKKPFFAIA